MSTSAENAQIAKDVLVDLVDCSGIDLAKLDILLIQFSQEVKSLDSEYYLALSQKFIEVLHHQSTSFAGA